MTVTLWHLCGLQLCMIGTCLLGAVTQATGFDFQGLFAFCPDPPPQPLARQFVGERFCRPDFAHAWAQKATDAGGFSEKRCGLAKSLALQGRVGRKAIRLSSPRQPKAAGTVGSANMPTPCYRMKSPCSGSHLWLWGRLTSESETQICCW